MHHLGRPVSFETVSGCNDDTCLRHTLPTLTKDCPHCRMSSERLMFKDIVGCTMSAKSSKTIHILRLIETRGEHKCPMLPSIALTHPRWATLGDPPS